VPRPAKPARHTRGEHRGVFLVLGAALLWSTGGIGIKAVAAPALTVACWRSAVAALALWAFFRPALRRDAPFALGVVCYAGCLTTFVVATKWTAAANAIFLQYSGVVWVMLLAPWVVGEERRREDGLAIAVAFAGIALFFADSIDIRGRMGDLVGLGSGLFFAGVVLTLRRMRGGGAEAVVTWGNALVALVLLPLALHGPALSARDTTIVVALGVIQLAAAYILFVRGIQHVPATEAALLGMAEPVANPIWVGLLLGEIPRPWAWAGGALVLGAIAFRIRPETMSRGGTDVSV
jgi:drug/metabolite transporter (DMT)-like permease